MHFLIVEGRAEERELITRRLRRHFAGLQLTDVTNAEEFHQALNGAPFELVLTGYEMGWTDGLQVMRQVLVRFPTVPVIIVSDVDNAEVAANGMRNGLSDYVLKQHIERLPIAIQSSLDRAELRREFERSQRELQRSEERYRLITRRVTDMAYTLRVEPDGRVLPEWNSGTHALTGYTDEELAARGPWISLIDPADRSIFETHVARLLAGQPDTVEFRIVTRSGATRWLRMISQPEFDPLEQRVIRIYGGIQDVTTQRRAEESLQRSQDELKVRAQECAETLQEQTEQLESQREELGTQNEELETQSEEWEVQAEEARQQADELNFQAQELAMERARLQAIIEHAPYAIVVADAQARILLTNPEADRLYARPVPVGQEYESHAILRLAYPDGTPYNARNLPLTRSALDGESFFDVEVSILWPDGQRRNLLASSVPIRDPQGRIVGAMAMFQDVTGRKRRESNASFLADLSQDLARAQPPEEMMRTTGAKMKEHFGVNRVVLAEVDSGAGTVTGLYDSREPDLTKRLEIELLSTYGSVEWLHEQQTGRAMVIDDVNTDPRTAPYAAYRKIDVRAQLFVPLVQDGKVCFLIALQRSEPYHWREDEIELAQEIAARLYPRLEQARTEEALRESERKYRELVHYAPAGISEVDFRTRRFISVNEAITEITGYSREELLAMDMFDILDEPSQKLLQARTAQWLQGQPPERNVEYRVKTKDGRILDVVLNVTFTSDEHGRPLGATVVAYDVTALKRAEEAQRMAKERLEATLAALPDLLFEVDRFGRYYEVHAPHPELLVAPPDQFPGKTVREMLPAEAAEIIMDALAQAAETGRHQGAIYMLPLPDGQHWFELSIATKGSLPQENPRLVVLAHDITARQETEEALRASQARLEAVFAAVPNVLVEYDVHLRPVHASEAALKTLGFDSLDFTREQVMAQLQFRHLDGSPTPKENLPIVRALQGKRVSGELYRVCTADQDERIVAIYAAPFYRDDQVNGVVTLWHDITERRQAEEALQAALAEVEESRQLSETRNRINDLLVSSLDVTPVLSQVLAETVQGLGLNYGVLLYRQGESWVTGPAYGLPQLPSGQVFSEQEAELTTWAARHRQVLTVEDVTRDPRFQAMVLRGYGVRSFMAVPLILQERVTGALLVGSSEVVHFRPAQLDSARKVAYGLALAQENARLYEQAQKDAETRATLLREVNHRVKNNLAAIVGLMYAQLARQDVQNQPICQDVLHNLILGTENLSIVHGMLAAVEWAPLPLDELVSRVLRSTLQVVPGEQLVIQVRPSMLRVTSNQAHTLALVVNELATNMAKYALAGRTTLQVTATAERIDDEAVLTIRDDGPGYPADVLAEIRSGAGLELVRNLVARNLRGQLVLRNESGAVTEVRFPLTEAQSEG